MLDNGQKAAAGGAALSDERLGRYELIARIADGGMAEVYLARQLGPMNFQKVVVVKKIHQNLARQKEFIGMLLDEARISALIKHPRVVDIYDLGVSRGTYFIAMEYLAGQPLSEVIERGRTRNPLDVYSTARVIADAAEGLHAAHNLKTLAGRALELVHRDVSPTNIIVLYDAGVKLVDFGVAKARGRITATDTRQIKGRVGYVAPEQIMENPVDRRSDVFALGVVLWEALALRRLFDAESEAGKLRQILEGTPLPPSAHRPEVPYELDKICLRALSVKPDDRFQTAAEMQTALEQFLDDANFRREGGAIVRFMDEQFAPERQAQEALLRMAAERAPKLSNGPVVSGVVATEEVDTDVRTFVARPGEVDPFEAPTNALPSRKATAAAALVAAAHSKPAATSASKMPARSAPAAGSAPRPPAVAPAAGVGGGEVVTVVLPRSATQRVVDATESGRTTAIAKSAVAAARSEAENKAAGPPPEAPLAVPEAPSDDETPIAADSFTQIPVVIESRARGRGDDTGSETGQVVLTRPQGKRTGAGKIALPAVEDAPAQRQLGGRMLPLPAPAPARPSGLHAAVTLPDDVHLPIDVDDDADEVGDDVTDVDLTGSKPFEATVSAVAAADGKVIAPSPTKLDDDASGMRAVAAIVRRGRRKRIGLVLGGIALALGVVVVVLLRSIATPDPATAPVTAAAPAAPPERAPAAREAVAPEPAALEPPPEPVPAAPTRAEPAALEPSPEPTIALSERTKAARTRPRAVPTPPSVSEPRRATESPAELYTAGAKLYLSGKLPDARSKFQAALKISPRYAPAHRGLGLVQERAGQTARAIQSLETYLRLAPRAADAIAIRARITRLRK